jgi:hypothetical protein
VGALPDDPFAGTHLFAVEGLDYFKIRFEIDEKGRSTALVGLYDDGRTDRSARTR